MGGITSKKHFSSLDKTSSILTRASEKSTLGIRINIEDRNKSDVNDICTINENKNDIRGDNEYKNKVSSGDNSNNSGKSKDKINCSWILPLNQDNNNNDEKQLNSLKTIKVIERFECLNNGSKIFSNEILKAKKLKLKEESSEAETGPRSIAQVRRENKKSDNDNNNGNENSTMNIDDVLQNVKIHENENENNSSQFFSSKKYNKFPQSVYDLAKVDGDNDSITVIVYWVCRINGKIIRGIHSLGGASILPETLQIISLLTKPINTTDNAVISKLDDASDYLSLALKYPISAILSKNEKNKNIEIFLEIKSNSKKILIISAEIIDKKNRAITPEIGLNSSNIDRNPNFHSQRGLRWERKTNITDIVLFPYESKSVSFYAVVSMPGVFDLNRYVLYRTVPYLERTLRVIVLYKVKIICIYTFYQVNDMFCLMLISNSILSSHVDGLKVILLNILHTYKTLRLFIQQLIVHNLFTTVVFYFLFKSITFFLSEM